MSSAMTPTQALQLRNFKHLVPGASLRQCAEALGNVVSHETIRKWCIALGLAHSRHVRPATKFNQARGSGRRTCTMTREQEARLRQIQAESPWASLRERARALGNVVSHQTIKRWCMKLGLDYCNTQGRLRQSACQLSRHCSD